MKAHDLSERAPDEEPAEAGFLIGEELAPELEVADPEPEPEPEVDNLTGSWRGLPNYECPFCMFRTLSPERFSDHLKMRHPAAERRG